MPLAGKIQGALAAALGLVYPEACQLCHAERATPADGFVGARCRSRVRFIRPPFCGRCGLPFAGSLTTDFVCTNCHELELHFTSARSAAVAKTVVLEAIHRYKYSGSVWFENFLTGLLLHEAVPALRGEKWDWLAPVPLHPLKLRERGFNQAERMAWHLSRATGIPLAKNLLVRTHATATQTLLSREQRAANMKNAFTANPRARPAGKKVVVVDDVLTTGATTNACAQALRRAGATEVAVWTVARGL